MTILREFSPERSGINILHLVLAAILLSGPIAGQEPAEMPVVTWTAGDKPNVRYLFLQNVKTTTLLHATSETGTFNHHGYLAYYQGVLFAVWDNQARDEYPDSVP